MQWTDEVALGDWLRDRLDDPWRRSIHDVVPRGFAAYARVLHPAYRERPVGRDWPPQPVERHRDAWADFADDRPEIDTEAVTWAETAEAFGRTMHPEAQWNRLLGSDDPYGGSRARDAAGWQYSDPAIGRLDPERLAALAGVLAGATTTPDSGVAAVWEGWGGLVGAMGLGPSRAVLTFTDGDDEADARHREFLAHSVHQPFERPWGRESWQPGILSDEISGGARFELPHRAYVLFRAGAADFADPAWPARAPWADPRSGGFGTESPSLLWPDDRAWVLATEVDFDSTLVGGSAELVAAICATPGLEALPLPADADLTWAGDRINR
ncbi:hypothetical protein [Agromyces seonyuensis]|uniref:Uncharacterized protein n=1 Tax=Agromyces seonyuensis TaxID=2662446 RepID=A0A6I4NXZ1_9MICO|nr:hypothetical protein [Agromyces seonyuensis]MWB99153.1 hypothetical protein [Agromyces seonyuensis]